jgi:hypothetical protein
MPATYKLRLGNLLDTHPRYGPVGCFYIGKGKTRGDITRPIVPYEDYTFDLNNVNPAAYQELLIENTRRIRLRWRKFSNRKRAKAEKYGSRVRN